MPFSEIADLHSVYTFNIGVNINEEEILSELFIDGLNLSRILIRESTKLKLIK